MTVARFVFRFSFFVFPCFLAGCEVLGVAAYKLSPPPTIKPQYEGLAGQSIGVMVWADRGLRIDWPNLQLDLANAIQQKMQASKEKQLKDARFDVAPGSIVRYQKDHPLIEAGHITEIAPKLGVTRLIYVELDDFATRSDMAVDLYRGTAKATVRVIEVDDQKQGKVVYDNHDVRGVFPKKASSEGVPGLGDAKVYAGLVDAFATEIVHLFVQWQPEDW